MAIAVCWPFLLFKKKFIDTVSYPLLMHVRCNEMRLKDVLNLFKKKQRKENIAKPSYK